MPLSDLQTAILLLLAAHRKPESDGTGATALNHDGARFSDDIDIFHDREEAVAAAARMPRCRPRRSSVSNVCGRPHSLSSPALIISPDVGAFR